MLTKTPAPGAPRPYAMACDRLAAMAAERPGAIAFEAGDRRMTYREFDERANRLGRYLLSLGAGPGATVAVHLPRSIEQCLCVAAAMKAGACFLPLDPAWPELRTRAMLDDAGAMLVITSADAAPGLGGPGRQTVELERAAAAIDAASSAPLSSNLPPDSLAYLIFTSGSTGGPKGVEITWGGLHHMIETKRANFCLRAADRVSHGAGVAFDGALTEVWPVLSVGATVVLVDEAVRTSAEKLQDWIVRERITVSALVPPVLAERMIVADWPATTALRVMMAAGEALHVYPAPGLPFVLLNGYGPTECAVETTAGLVPTQAGAAGPPPLGRPIPGISVYILDANGQPVKQGAIGEMYVSGPTVGRGYRNRPEETARRFLPDPFSDVPGARMFRTGDLGSYRADGQIDFHGRIDDQLQIRGYRVEPDEVAAALARHPLVASCAVAPNQGRRQGAELLAYIVPSPHGTPTASALQEFLAERVPQYMLPAAYVLLEALPLTLNGKVDRAALPKPHPADVLKGPAFRATQTVAEERLAGLFEQVLKCDPVGVDDDFFLLGGHSLLAAEMVQRTSEAFGLDLKPQVLFEARTVGRMAERIEALLIESLEAMSEDEAQADLSGRFADAAHGA
jgi:amino acid adenylation domain-containing protein